MPVERTRFRAVFRRLYGTPWMVVIVGVFVTSVVFWEARTAGMKDFRARFETRSATRANQVVGELEESHSVMRALVEFVQKNNRLDAQDFHSLSAPFLGAREAIEAVGWVPAQGMAEESGAPGDGSGRPHLKNLPPTRQKPSSPSTNLYPVRYIESPGSTGVAAGFDFGSDPALRAAIRQSVDTGTSVATPWPTKHEGDSHLDLLLFLPIYESGRTPGRKEERRRALRGLVFGLLRIDDVLADLFVTNQPDGLSIDFLDFPDGTRERLLYRRSVPVTGHKSFWVSSLLPAPTPFLYKAAFGGREWGIRTTPGEAYYRKHYGLSHWLVLPVGLVLTLLLALYRRSIRIQWTRMERAIEERTAKLREHERNLEKLVRERTESLSWKTAFLEAVTNASQDGIVVIDNDGKEAFHNKQAEELWKIPRNADSPNELTSGTSPLPDSLDGSPQFEQDLFSIQAPGNVCMRREIELQEGTVLDTYSSPVLGEDGTCYGRIWIFRDITERKRAEEALKRSEATLRSVVSASPVGIALMTPQRGIGWASEAMHTITGYAPEDVDGKSSRVLYETGEEFTRVCEIIYGEKSCGAAGMIDTRWVRKNGTLIDVSLGAVPVDAENPLSDLVIAAIDITDRKRAEETLRDSENKFRDLAEKSFLGISLIQDGYYRSVNERFASIHGLTVDEMMDRPATLEMIHSEDRERVEQHVWKDPAGGHKPLEFRIVAANGEARTVLAYASATTYKLKPAVAATLLDITEQRQAEASVRENEVLLSYATELAKIVYWEHDEVSGEFIFNDAFFAFCGTTAEREGGYRMGRAEYVKNFVHPDDAQEVGRRSRENRQRADSSASSEHRMIRRDGTVIHVVARTRYFRDAEGRVVKTIGANQDITEQKSVEEALTWKTAFLEAQVNSSLDGILVVEGNGKAILRNQRLVDMWKLPEHILDSKDAKREFKHALSMTRYPEVFKEKMVFLHGNPNATSRDEIHLKDGTVLDTYSCPVLGKDGVYYGRIWTFRDVTELKHYWDMLESLSNTDGLTDLANRRRFDDFLNREWRRALRDRSCLSLIMMDIDFFKEFNDNYGHLAGDDCLRQAAGILNEIVQRPGDLVSRYGGEEFACILPNTGSEGAEALANRIRNAVKTASMPHFFSPIADHVTLSFGVATLVPEAGQMPSELVRLADDLLYSAKKDGRDQVRNWQPVAPAPTKTVRATHVLT